MAGKLVLSTLNDDTGVLNVQNGMTGIPKAWLNYNGNTQTITGSFNVSSVTYNTTGDYTVNLTTPMSNANYSIAGSSGGQNSTSAGAVYLYDQATARTTSLFRILIINTSGGVTNTPQVNVIVCGS